MKAGSKSGCDKQGVQQLLFLFHGQNILGFQAVIHAVFEKINAQIGK